MLLCAIYRWLEQVYGKGALRHLAEMSLSLDEYEGNNDAYEWYIGKTLDYFATPVKLKV